MKTFCDKFLPKKREQLLSGLYRIKKVTVYSNPYLSRFSKSRETENVDASWWFFIAAIKSFFFLSVIPCSAPAVANGRMNEFGYQHKPKDTVSITCSEGFDLIGSPQVTCGPDGQWQGLPECRPKRLLVNGRCINNIIIHVLKHLELWSCDTEDYSNDA